MKKIEDSYEALDSAAEASSHHNLELESSRAMHAIALLIHDFQRSIPVHDWVLIKYEYEEGVPFGVDILHVIAFQECKSHSDLGCRDLYPVTWVNGEGCASSDKIPGELVRAQVKVPSGRTLGEIADGGMTEEEAEWIRESYNVKVKPKPNPKPDRYVAP